MKAMLILTAFMAVVLTAFQLLLGKYISLEIPGQEIMLGMVFSSAVFFTLRRV